MLWRFIHTSGPPIWCSPSNTRHGTGLRARRGGPHYRDGIEAALSGDTGERLDWLIDNQERMNAALERATIVLSGLPAHPEEDYSPVPDMAIPGGGQRLGLSSRGY